MRNSIEFYGTIDFFFFVLLISKIAQIKEQA